MTVLTILAEAKRRVRATEEALSGLEHVERVKRELAGVHELIRDAMGPMEADAVRTAAAIAACRDAVQRMDWRDAFAALDRMEAK